MNRRIKAFVLFSVTLNVLLAGVLLGTFTHRASSPWLNNMLISGSSLPKEKQLLWEGTLEKAGEESREMRATIRKEREKLFTLLASESFDEEAYDRQQQKINAMMGEQKKRMSDRVKAFARTLKPEERATFADALKRTGPAECRVPEAKKPDASPPH